MDKNGTYTPIICLISWLLLTKWRAQMTARIGLNLEQASYYVPVKSLPYLWIESGLSLGAMRIGSSEFIPVLTFSAQLEL
jgi:hypothetical protein